MLNSFFSDWLDSDSFDNPDDSTLIQLIWVRVEPKVLTQILLMIYHSLFNVVKSSWPVGEGAAGCIFVGRFSLQRYSNMQKIRSFSVELMTQLWLEQLSVESTLAQVTISVTQFSDSTQLLKFPTRLKSDSRQSQSEICVRVKSNLTHDSWVQHKPVSVLADTSK